MESMKEGPTPLQALIDRIEAQQAVVAVVGLGYVGLPVALSFAEAGFSVLGMDLREEKVETINSGRSHLHEIPNKRVSSAVESGRLDATTSFEALSEADAVIVCVPTPLAKGAPDLSNVVFATESLGKTLKPGALFVLESTTYPGTTEELLQPLLEAGGMKAGEDFFLAFSPERIDPGNPLYDFSDIPKVVGGVNEASTRAAAALYQQVVPKVVTVSGTREAEMSKLIENTYRHINIALINELAVYSHEMGIDIWESIEAAATKPFGFMPFWPSPGWGGHCIPLDPSYLSWKVRQYRDHEIRFIELAQSVNSEMPRHVVERIANLLNEDNKSVKGAKVLCIGVAYKGGSQDVRESAGLRVISALRKRGAQVSYHDPLVEEVEVGDTSMQSVELTDNVLQNQDVVVILIPQTDVDWNLIAEHAPLTFDCCNALKARSPKNHRL
jgi:UDP-N-acetyl-D-glucosamine dehydrogenase